MMNKKILLGTVVALATLVTSKGKNRKTRWKSAGFKLGKRRERDFFEPFITALIVS